MKKRLILLVALCISLATAVFPDEPRYVVTLAPTATMSDPEALATRLARTYGGSVEAVEGRVITILVSPSRAALLGRDPNVQSIVSAAVPEKVSTDAISWNAGVSYAYDGSGNVRKIGTDTFSYDVAGRLVEAHTGGVKRQYEYDAFGNRTKCSDANGNTCQDAETISASSNRSSAMTYNVAGDVIAYGGHTYTFDEFHMLTSDTYGSLTREFIYNANDQRIAVLTSAPSGSWWRWTFRDPLSGKVLREFTSQGVAGTSSWKWEKDYIWRDGLLLATMQPNTTGTGTITHHYHLDHLGTPRRITDDADVIVGVHDYHAFGPELTGGTDERSLSLMKYTGHERDIVDGHPDSLDYMMARYYSPSLGRFLSVDPIMPVEAMRSPQLWNRYSYVGNNPMNRIDPTGKILQFAGGTEDLEKVKQIANSGLHGYELNINDKGIASLQKVKVKGKETSEQKALREGLQKVIGDKATTSINVASGARGVVIGQFNMRTIDPTDMQKFGSVQPSAASTLGHEVMEQYAGQVLGMTNVAAAHTWAIRQENLFTGWTRGGQTPTKGLPNGQAYGDVRYTRGNEAMDVRVTVDPRTFDVTSVTRIPVP